MLNIRKVVKPWQEAGSLNANVNLRLRRGGCLHHQIRRSWRRSELWGR